MALRGPVGHRVPFTHANGPEVPGVGFQRRIRLPASFHQTLLVSGHPSPHVEWRHLVKAIGRRFIENKVIADALFRTRLPAKLGCE